MHTIKNQNGMIVEIIDLGATVVSIKVQDRKGKFDDVTLGFDKLEEFKNNTVYFGTTAGRYANRISEGRFSLNGKEYQLTINNGLNHLHGGTEGINQKIWKIENKSTESIKLSCISPDGEQGYPGTVKITVIYTVTNQNGLKIDYEGITDAPTILNLTNHCYFNLSENKDSTILNHEVFIDADNFTPTDQNSIPTGVIEAVNNTPMDFRIAKPIGLHINDNNKQLKFGNGYDHNFVLNNSNGLVRKVASVYDEISGRFLEVLTDQPGLQFYSGNFLEGIKGKDSLFYKKHSGLCLEAQNFPDAPNNNNFPTAQLIPGDKYTQTTIYQFSVR